MDLNNLYSYTRSFAGFFIKLGLSMFLFTDDKLWFRSRQIYDNVHFQSPNGARNINDQLLANHFHFYLCSLPTGKRNWRHGKGC